VAEPTQPPIEEEVELLTTPTPAPTATPAPTPTQLTATTAALTAQEAYELFLAEAQTWQSDAALTELTTSLLGALEADGASTGWTAKFWSPSVKAINTMLMLNGEPQGTPLEVPDEQTTIANVEALVLDTKTIYETAANAGGNAYLSEGKTVMAGLIAYPLDSTLPTWYIHYQDPTTYQVAFTVIINARNGEVMETITAEQ
jgi:hypothetical protein